MALRWCPKGGWTESQASAKVLIQAMGNHCAFEAQPTSTYDPVIDVGERKTLVKLAERLADTHFFNGSCARLESIDTSSSVPSVALSTVDFFDFVAINVVLENENRVLASATPEEERLLQKVAAIRSALKKDASFADVLATRGLPNVLALSCLIHDRMGRCFLARRKAIGIGAGQVSCSVTGTIEACDLANPNPAFACAQRECQEELGVTPLLGSMQLVGFAFGVHKMQPAALVTVLVDDIEEVTQGIAAATDFGEENSGFEICSTSQALEDNTIKPPLTDIARAHLRLAV